MKKTIRSAAALFLTAVLILTAAGCAGPEDSEKQVAKINDTVITQGELDTYTALDIYREGYDPSEADVGQKQECLNEMVDAEVIRQYYREQAIDIYNDAYNSGRDSFLNEIRNNEAEFLEQNDISEEELIDYYEDQYVISSFFEETRAAYDEGRIAQEAADYYEKHIDDYKIEKQKRISLILTKKKKKAAAAIERLDGGEDFAAVARDVSTDENSSVNGGDLGFFTKQETVDRFGKGVFGMDVGEYTEKPVTTADGYAVLKITDFNDSGYHSYDEVSQGIIYSLYENYNKERIAVIREDMEIELSELR